MDELDRIDVMPNSSRSGAMTFTRDTTVVTGDGDAVVLRNHGRRGDLEPEHVAAWLDEHGIGDGYIAVIDGEPLLIEGDG